MTTSGKPISLAPLTPLEALRRAMRAPVPKDEPKAVHKPKPTTKGKKVAKKKG